MIQLEMPAYRYQEPPVPEEPVLTDGEVAIEVPEKEGTPVTVLTYSNGMTLYLRRSWHDWDAARRVAEAIEVFLAGEWQMMGFEPSSMPEKGLVYLTRKTVETLMNIHDEVVKSPLAVPTQAGRRIIVAGANDVVLKAHGPGKRRNK